MKPLQFTVQGNNNPVWINPQSISAIMGGNTGSTIYLTGGAHFAVTANVTDVLGQLPDFEQQEIGKTRAA
jgi:hypothetical protein